MTVVSRSNHAFFFDGVSDSILVPEGAFSSLGIKNSDGGTSVRNILSPTTPQSLTSITSAEWHSYLTIEAWVTPDCGGTVIEKDGQFRLTVGSVDTPGPAVFEVTLTDGNVSRTHELRTATKVSTTRYEGTIYPSSTFGGMHDYYNRFNTGTYGLATDLNKNHRPLLHIVAAVRKNSIELYINGKLMVKESTKDRGLKLVNSNSNVYIGGKGGKFRGVMEAIHLNSNFMNTMVDGNCPLPNNTTLLLYKFEEPIAPVETVYTFSAISGSYDSATLGTITLSQSDAQSLALALTGNSTTTGSIDFKASPYSSGNYEIHDASTGSTVNRLVPHVPYNLVINPGSINPNTKKPNQSPPERVRLLSINDLGSANPTLTVSSIHLNEDNSTNDNLMGILHTSRTTDVDNHFVVVGADLLIDSDSNKPYQPPHYNTQIIDRTGQMVIDESPYGNHGFVYSSNMATTDNDSDNPFAITWPSDVDTIYMTGHSGRHAQNHVEGHEFLKMLPSAMEEIVDLRSDGSADVIDIVYDEMQKGVEEQISINSRVDIFREFDTLDINEVVNTSAVTAAYHSYQNTSSPPAGKRTLIAIGGPDFDFRPFLLKGPCPDLGGTYEDSVRLHHLRPSKKSRVALLHVPQLTSTNTKFAPFVEIHYNAIDLTGASMSGTGQPLLMVEKTVPACDVPTGGGSYIYDAIIDAIGSGKTLYSPGGYIEVNASKLGVAIPFSPHGLLGDNNEGYSADNEIDESLCPANYTPRADSTSVNTTPQVILESVSTTKNHESVFNKLVFNKVIPKKALTDKGNYERIEPDTVVDSPANGQFDTGVTSSSTPIHEMFDIIDNIAILDSNISDTRLIIQPSDRRRTNQLAHLRSTSDVGDNNIISTLFLMSRARIRSIESNEDENGSFTTIKCAGLSGTAISRNIEFSGRGSPDSHIVKEIEPNSPVVTVTLGGPGQGGVDTQPVYQRSVLAHESYSSRRSYALTATRLVMNWSAKTGTLDVSPLNNESDSLSSWGTYGFPRYGRIYLADGSSAKYNSKTGSQFSFASSTLGSGDFVSSNGSEYDNIGALLSATGFMKGDTTGVAVIAGNFTIYSEDNFGEESDLENGSTVNDKMHQSLSDVMQDYQLGTQYASTRAIAEIPIFNKQLFHDQVGPDNAFKIHIDATHTAHTYNPSPVGRRLTDVAPADREAQSAYAYSIANNTHVDSTFITKYDETNKRIYVNDISVFPPVITAGQFQGIGQVADINTSKVYVPRYRKVFLSNGEWSWYTNTDPVGDTYLQLGTTEYSQTEGFLDGMEVGTPIYVGGPLLDSDLEAITSDDFTPSSDVEDRGEYYFDAASVKTQGGNVDYGLRQYVSAVEFKAGPESNPHTPSIESERASAIVQSTKFYTLASSTPNLPSDTLKAIIITLSDEDFAKFPDLGYSEFKDMPTGTGTLRYCVQYDDGTNTFDYQYHGHLSRLPITSFSTTEPQLVAENAIVLVYCDTGSYPADIDGEKITLAKKCRDIISTNLSGSVKVTDTATGEYPLYAELNDNLMIDTNIAITAQAADSSAPFTIEITNQTGKNVNNLHGLNVKKDDILYYKTSANVIEKIGTVTKVTEALANDKQTITLSAATPIIPANAKLAVWIGDYEDKDAILNAKWLNPYASGGFRDGDTVWANMSYNNPHAVEGLFAKSRGVLNESQVWNGFNGGVGELDNSPRNSIPLENFLIGNTCLKTAENYVQHVNKTIEENYKSLGLTADQAPVVAYLDPYLSTEEHTRVLLYDVAHDREFIAFQDIHMQVQTSAQTPQLGWPKAVVEDGATEATGNTPLHQVNAAYGGSAPSPWTTQIDVTNGFPSQNPYIRSTQQSKFIESAYAHDVANRQTSDILHSTSTTPFSGDVLPDDGRKIVGARLYGKAHGHHIHTGYSYGGTLSGYHNGYDITPRVQDATTLFKVANSYHPLTRVMRDDVDTFTHELIKSRSEPLRDPSTLFDTPDGTRVIPAFLCLKGIRSSTLDLSDHDESRLQHLPQWNEMDFVRRLTVDMGEVSTRENVTSVLSGVEEVVRLINQHGALNAKTSGVSAHDPSPFWSVDDGNKGTHMGYIRAHIGREVEDLNGDLGYTVVIHSTVPGASGRNFCVWLDNSTGQTAYEPQFLIGHGGRWRNFWALPEESEGENMHPAPMPLNKHGRPFSPITSLQQYITSENSGEKVESVGFFEDEPYLRAASDSLSGKNHNTTDLESFDIKGSSSSLVKGLRTGSSPIARVNFGGLVASGVPGWSPAAGLWGYGKEGDSDYTNRYGTQSSETYSSYATRAEILPDVIGQAPIYGLRLKDNNGNESGVRYIYKTMDDAFANSNTTLPDTLEEEVAIFFDDRDVAQGGFTIGKHMHGSGDVTGRMEIDGVTNSNSPAVTKNDFSWMGNQWRGVPAPDMTQEVINLSLSGTTLTVTFKSYMVDYLVHDDRLGYLGFPKENGIIHFSGYKQTGPSYHGYFGYTATYTRREGDVFYGVNGVTSSQLNNLMIRKYISPTMNWTTLVTDELMSAVTAAAINAGEEINDKAGLTFDCTSMYAADGRTFGDWGVSPNAIKIRSFSNKLKPLRLNYRASVHRDHGIKAAHLEFGELEKSTRPTGTAGWDFGTSRAATDALIDAGRTIDCGYVPYTVLRIEALSKGPNGNTATPVLVDSANNPVDTTKWREGLKGMRFTRSSGDHILPKIDNPHAEFNSAMTDTWGGRYMILTTRAWHFLIPKFNNSGDKVKPAGERRRVWLNSKASVVVESYNTTGSTSGDGQRIQWVDGSESSDWPSSEPVTSFLSHYGDIERTKEFDGLRSIGSVFSEPIVYFRGGKRSVDHSVPLFFGGGFSGVVMDVNDGTANDYSSFYTHPYANGPTGVAGLQNANEISTSHAILDANAMFAFFPGTALCNQHRASMTSPFFNKQNVLAPDLHSKNTTYGNVASQTNGEVKAKPVPLILRFPHPTARYDDHTDGVDIDSKTTYLIFGPGQAFPFTRETNNTGGTHGNLYGNLDNKYEPHPGRIVADTNTWASVPRDDTLTTPTFPNQADNDKFNFMPPSKTYYDAHAGFHWKAMVNWETPAGYCWQQKWKQRPEHGRNYGQTFNDDTPYDISGTASIANDLRHAHPKMHTPLIGFGITMGADTVFHMDGGFHPGGSWLDNQLTFNPPHEKMGGRINGLAWEADNQLHPTAFRTAGVLTGRILDYIGSNTVVSGDDTKNEYVVVDATRCQNGEELATVVGAAINAFPGAGALKAMGGTHMPSMGNSMRQDKYAWRALGVPTAYVDNSGTGNYIDSAVNASQSSLEQVPASGWLRVHNGNTTYFACYHSREVIADSSNWKVRFYLAPNRLNGASVFEGPLTWQHKKGGPSHTIPTLTSSFTLFVWTKAGTIRFNNEDDSTRDHMTQVHFSGIADAIDRTRPIGVAGWHGERYSYLNSLKMTKNTSGTGYAAGLGAYHPMLGFNPYGVAGSVITKHSHLPVVSPQQFSPESTSTIDGIGAKVAKYIKKTQFYTDYNLQTGSGETWNSSNVTYAFKDTDVLTGDNVFDLPYNNVVADDYDKQPAELSSAHGLYTNAFLVVSYESESALVAKHDRDSIRCTGDMLHTKQSSVTSIKYAGSTKWDIRYHDQDRFVAPANAGPNVEALIVDGTNVPTFDGSEHALTDEWSDNVTWAFFTAFSGSGWETAVANDLKLKNATPALNKTGDLLFDLDYSVGSALLESDDAERNVVDDYYDMGSDTYAAGGNYPSKYWMQDVNAFNTFASSPAKNFTVENVVWKRMDGGNLSLPTTNARGLGAVPWVTRVKDNTPYVMGEKIYGNNRFSFETTNSAMLPVLQAQELAHPKLMRKYPYEIGNALNIPNEEVQFRSIHVIDDAGQKHRIEGGSPLGTIIRGFRTPENRGTKGKAPALANSGNTPNLKVALPNPNSIPGNIVVRSGYDPVQSYQHESMGSGGMQHPDLSQTHTGHLFDNSVDGPRMAPTYEDHNWERINPVTFDSEIGAWNDSSPLQTSYELHDRTLFFHVCKMGHGHTHRYPTIYSDTSGGGAGGVVTDVVSVVSWDSTNSTLTVDGVLDTEVFDAKFGTKEVLGNRKFLRVYNPTTDEGAVCSYTAQGSVALTVVGDVDFSTFMAAQTVTDLKVVPSYYIPGGSTRFYAARRLRDHAEVSGNSPDMAQTLYFNNDIGYTAYSKPKMTPMPYPRMGHHYVTPTMPMLPGHWAHPAYQGLYKRHLADFNLLTGFKDAAFLSDNSTAKSKKADVTNLALTVNPMEPEINFSGVNAAPSPPSDIHGGAFTLMFETAIKYDGYGILATSGANAGDINKVGGHTIVLEAAANYTLGRHFPDPLEVGAYQIVIQPNLFSNQIIGYHNNTTDGLTSQQVNTVIAIKQDTSKGGLSLVLANEVGADVRGCEVFMNEATMDISPDHGSQFTNIPPLMSYNPLGVQLNETPSFTRRGFPYSKMFSPATPGHTLNIPWWSILHSDNPSSNSGIYAKLSQYAPEDYYHICRNSFGSIGKQLTINGYPSIYLDIYSDISQSISIIPKCTVKSFDIGSGRITVDNANTFPVKSYFSPVVEYTAKSGKKHKMALVNRSGYYFDMNKADFIDVTGGTSPFFTDLYIGAVLRLSDAYDTLPVGNLLTDKKKSVFANILPQIVNGNQDTNSKYVPDAFLCMWHPNLGRPNTYFSDSRTSFGANAIDKKAYNSMPEHFETIHYHDFSYAISTGPFDFLIKRPDKDKDGTITAGDADHDAGGTNVMLTGYWPCGSRGGPQASDLGFYGYVSATWNTHDASSTANYSTATQYEFVDSDDDGDYRNTAATGISIGSSANGQRRAYGYRIALLQACNRPRYGIMPARALYESTTLVDGGKNTTDNTSGPLVQMSSQEWEKGADSATSKTFPITYVGVMERLTDFTGRLGHDKAENQVRYSDGRRMTRPFGTPIRTLRNLAYHSGTNATPAQRDWWGDDEGMGITSLSTASQYYLVDWWGNERGEDVRRAPVRGFGIRPAWDCGDAYEYDRRNSRSPYRRVWNNGKPIFNMKGIVDLSNGNISVTAGNTIPRFGGTDNDENLNGNNNDLVDVFAPTHALRVGDMGNGRGVRYPTAFNEDVLTELSAPIHKTGVVLSHNTAEPLFGEGLIRPKDTVLEADEVKRGISARLGIDEDGLLKTDAIVSDKVETITGDTPHKTAISRSSPRIGLDATISEDVEQNHIAINTEAHSLHTDRNVGQKVTFLGASHLLSGASQLYDANYTSVSFARQAGGSSVYSAHKYSHTNIFRPYGGSYVMESKNYAGFFDDTGWGVSNLTAGLKTTNPYQNLTFKSNTVRNNEKDNSVKFLIRPIRLLDNKHVEVFRPHDSLHSSSPQYVQNYLRATSGGKYGIFTYEVSNGRTETANIHTGRTIPDGDGPYLPIFGFDSTGTFATPSSHGPKIPGTEVTGFDKTSLLSTQSSLVITENTLQHHRSDAPRRRQEGDTDDELSKPDYKVKPRFSQSLHSKGHKGDVTYSVSDHTGDGA